MKDTVLLAPNAADGAVRYRMPAIVRTSSRALLLAYECRPINDEKTPFSGSTIKLQRSFDHGLTWSDPVTVYGEDTPNLHEGYSSPSFIVDLVTGQVFLMATQYLGADEPEASQHSLVRVLLAFSEDDGATWRSRDISTQINGANKWRSREGTSGHGVQLKQGIWTGRMVQAVRVITPEGEPAVVTVCSDDHGRTWWSGKPVMGKASGAAVVELSDGRIILQIPEENDQTITVKRYFSMDGGRSFGPGLVAASPPLLDNDENVEGEEPSSDAAQLTAMLARAGFLAGDDPQGTPEETPRWSNSMERAFPCAIPGMEQARIVLLPTLSPLVKSDVDDQELAVTVSTNDGQTTHQQTVYVAGRVYDADTVSLPDLRLALMAIETERGIEMSQICLDAIGLHDYAYGWNEHPADQDKLLKERGFIK